MEIVRIVLFVIWLAAVFIMLQLMRSSATKVGYAKAELIYWEVCETLLNDITIPIETRTEIVGRMILEWEKREEGGKNGKNRGV